VVEIIEDIDDYRGFEAAIIADYDARTAVERELVLRLKSLLWRLRRAGAIETDLLRIQAEILRDRRQAQFGEWSSNRASPVLKTTNSSNENHNEPRHTDRFANHETAHLMPQPVDSARQLTLCFQRLTNLDDGLFERLGRYETAIARQVLKTLYLLGSARAR
jgi:hypothetical protein